jgi:transcriptional regulator with XRE-family HTH domain
MAWNPDRLARLRKRRGLTQAQLAAKAGAHRVTIAKFETGGRGPKVDLLVRLAKALRVRIGDLLR